MKQKSFGSYHFSQLTLGTVQLGLDYGVSNAGGIPAEQEIQLMLNYALEAGITTWDTARQYGTSEQVLGTFLQNRIEENTVNLVSKFKISPANLDSLERAWKEVYESVTQSLSTLGVERLPVAMLHKGDEPIQKVMKILPGIIRRLKEEELIAIGGLSAYFPEDVPWFLDEEEIQATQVPLNIFDQRLVKSGLLDQMEKADKLVFVRSLFLQGLFFMDPDQLTGNLRGAAPYLSSLRTLADNAEMSVAQLAFSYVRDLPGVSSIVFGAINEQQIRDNVALLNGPSIPPELVEKSSQLFSTIDEVILTPGKWQK